MKKITLSLLILSFIFKGYSQTAFTENGSNLTLGYGFPNLYKSILKINYSIIKTGAYSSDFAYAITGSGPFFLKYEYGVTDEIGLGIVLGYFSAGLEQTYRYQAETYNFQTQSYTTQNYKDVNTIRIQSASVGFRFNYHFGKKEKLDPYIGFATGYTHSTSTITNTTDNPNGSGFSFSSTNPIPIYLGLTFGLRYYFNPNIGLYAEAGLDKWAVIQGGLAFKFK